MYHIKGHRSKKLTKVIRKASYCSAHVGFRPASTPPLTKTHAVFPDDFVSVKRSVETRCADNNVDIVFLSITRADACFGYSFNI
jgi:hypothetical protein